MNLYYLSEPQLIVFALVLMRVSAFLVAFPLVETGNIPPTVKILLSLLMAMVMYPVVNAHGVPKEFLTDQLIVLCIKEVFMGLFVGFVARLFFQSLAICGDIVTMSVGLSADQFFNPHLDRRVTVIEEFELIVGGLFFLAMNGHHIFIQGLAESFNFVPIAQTSLNMNTIKDIAYITQEIITFGIKLSAPVLGAIFITNIALGIIGRAVPQINILVMSWPVNISLGLAVLFVSLPLFLLVLRENLNWGADTLFDLLKHL